MKVRDFMITKVFTAAPTTTVKELLTLLTSNRIGGVPVVDDKDIWSVSYLTVMY